MRRLKKLVRALEALPEDIKNRDAFTNVPNESPFLGLFRIACKDIPALKGYYEKSCKNNTIFDATFDSQWEYALNRYFGVDFVDWITCAFHEELWGNDDGKAYDTGRYLYHKGGYAHAQLVFGKENSKTFFNHHIVNHLIGFCNRYDSLSLKQKISLVWYDIGGWDTVSPFAFFLVFQPVFAFVVLRVTEGTTLPINPFN